MHGFLTLALLIRPAWATPFVNKKLSEQRKDFNKTLSDQRKAFNKKLSDQHNDLIGRIGDLRSNS